MESCSRGLKWSTPNGGNLTAGRKVGPPIFSCFFFRTTEQLSIENNLAKLLVLLVISKQGVIFEVFIPRMLYTKLNYELELPYKQVINNSLLIMQIYGIVLELIIRIRVTINIELIEKSGMNANNLKQRSMKKATTYSY